MPKATLPSLLKKKSDGRKITCLTAYDAPVASLIDASGIDIVLVGDSVGSAALGLDNTLSVTISDMLHHLKAVRRAVKDALLVCDMPMSSFTGGTALQDASALFAAGAEAVKIEGAAHTPLIEDLVKKGMPVMGHLGFTPQTDSTPSVKGRSEDSASELMKNAALLEKAGVFAIVLELVERSAAQKLTHSSCVPTIGIGSGPHCDGQVLVINDVIGMTLGKVPRFAKQYADVKSTISSAVRDFRRDVEELKYPS